MRAYGSHGLPELATRQSGVVSTEQLYALGFSRSQIFALVRRGILLPLYVGVYAVGHRRLSLQGRLIAARLAAGSGSFFSHRCAAGLRDLRRLDLGRLELTVPADHTPRQRGLILHRTTTPIDTAEVSLVSGLPVSTVPRLLVEVAADADRAELDELLAAAVRNDGFHPQRLEAALQRHGGRRGLARLKATADYYRPLPDRKSELERDFDREHSRRPEIPACERNVVLHGWEIDCLWREQGVVLELDGRRYHTARLDFDKDRHKDTALQLKGLRPMRVSYWMWCDGKERVLADLLSLLALGGR